MKVDERFASIFLRKNPTESARLLEAMDVDQAADVIRTAPVEIVAQILQKMLPAFSARYVASLGATYIAKLVEHLPSQSAAAILRQFTPEARDEALKPVNARQTAMLRLLLRYPPTAVGAWMDPQVTTLARDYSIRDARDKLDDIDRSHRKIFVLDRDRRLIGAIEVRALHLCDRNGGLDILLEPAESIRARESVVIAQKREIWERESHVPVVNRHNEFVGVVSYADLRKAQRQLTQASISTPADSGTSGIGELLLTGLVCTWNSIEDILISDDSAQDENHQ